MSTLSRNQQEVALSEVARIVGQVPAFCIYEWYVEPHLSCAHEFARAMTKNAAVDSSLLNVRCLDDFFRAAKQKDDVSVFHFTNQPVQSFLSPDKRREINKRLAHFTTERLTRPEGGYLLYELILDALIRGAEFLMFALREVIFNDAAVRNEVDQVFRASGNVVLEIIQRNKKDAAKISELEELLKKSGILPK